MLYIKIGNKVVNAESTDCFTINKCDDKKKGLYDVSFQTALGMQHAYIRTENGLIEFVEQLRKTLFVQANINILKEELDANV